MGKDEHPLDETLQNEATVDDKKNHKNSIALPVIGTFIFVLFWISYSGISQYFGWMDKILILKNPWFTIMSKSIIPWYLFIFYFLRKYKTIPNAWRYMKKNITTITQQQSQKKSKKRLGILLVLTDIIIPIIAGISIIIIAIMWFVYILPVSTNHKERLEYSRDFIYCFFINIPLAIKTLQNSYIGFRSL